MHGIIVEQRAEPGDSYSALMRDAESDGFSGVLADAKPLHSLRHAITFGHVDFLSIATFPNYQPFFSLPMAPTEMSRRMSGVLVPSERELREWADDSLFNGCISYQTPPKPKLPFLGVVYVELSMMRMIGGLPKTSGYAGPIRQTIGMLSRKNNNPFLERLTDLECHPNTENLRIYPLMGLDRIPVVMLIEAEDIESIAAVVRSIRYLTLSKRGLHMSTGLTALSKKVAPEKEALVSATMTVVGLQVHNDPSHGGREIQLTEERSEQHKPWFFPPSTKAPGDDADHIGLKKGWFQTSIRLPTTTSRSGALERLKLMPLSGPPDQSEEITLGNADTILATWNSVASLSRAFRQSEIQDLLLGLNGLKAVENSPLDAAAVKELRDFLYRTHTATLAITTSFSPSKFAGALWEAPLAEFDRAFAEKTEKKRAAAMGYDPKAPSWAQWRVQWRELCQSKSSLNYSLQVGGFRLIDKSLRLLSSDLLMFVEVLPSVYRLLRWGAQPVEPAQRGVGFISRLDDLHPYIEQFIQARSLRSAPIRRTPRSATAEEYRVSYEVTRLSFAALCNALAIQLGLADVTLLESTSGSLEIRTLSDWGAILSVPSTQFLTPFLWMIVCHELAHATFLHQTIHRLGDPRPGPEGLLLDAFKSAWRRMLPQELSSKKSWGRSLHDALMRVGERLKTYTDFWIQDRFHSLFSRNVEEVLSDLVSAAVWRGALERGRKQQDPMELLDIFMLSHGPGLVHAYRNYFGDQITASAFSGLLVRMFFFCRGFCLGMQIVRSQEKAAALEDVLDAIDWHDDFCQLLARLGSQPGTEPAPAWMVRCDQYIRRLAEDMALGSAKHDNELERIADSLWFQARRQKTHYTNREADPIGLITRWHEVCVLGFACWPLLRSFFRSTDPQDGAPQPLLVSCPGTDEDSGAWSEDVLKLYSEYLYKLRSVYTSLDPSGQVLLPWPRASSAHDLSGELPWFSPQGGFWTGHQEPRGGGFTEKYFPLTTRLMLSLAQRERCRRIWILGRWLGNDEPEAVQR